MARFQCYRTGESEIRWRLLGGNNRVLGIGPHGHDDQDSARDEVTRVQLSVDQGRFEIERAESGLWWWRFRCHGGILARSAQGFARRIDAELAAERFRARAPKAEIDSTLAVFQTNRRGRTSRGESQCAIERTSATATDVWPQRPVG